MPFTQEKRKNPFYLSQAPFPGYCSGCPEMCKFGAKKILIPNTPYCYRSKIGSQIIYEYFDENGKKIFGVNNKILSITYEAAIKNAHIIAKLCDKYHGR